MLRTLGRLVLVPIAVLLALLAAGAVLVTLGQVRSAWSRRWLDRVIR